MVLKRGPWASLSLSCHILIFQKPFEDNMTNGNVEVGPCVYSWYVAHFC